MKIKEANAGPLTNFEVLDFLRSRGASKDPTRVIVPVAQSEFKVYDYLVGSAACNQTREHIHEFFRRCAKFNLAKAEMLNLVNIRPASNAEVAALPDLFQLEISQIQYSSLPTYGGGIGCVLKFWNVFTIVEKYDERLNAEDLDELVELILEVLPEAPQQQTSKGTCEEEGGGEGTAHTNNEGEGGEVTTAEMQE